MSPRPPGVVATAAHHDRELLCRHAVVMRRWLAAAYASVLVWVLAVAVGTPQQAVGGFLTAAITCICATVWYCNGYGGAAVLRRRVGALAVESAEAAEAESAPPVPDLPPVPLTGPPDFDG